MTQSDKPARFVRAIETQQLVDRFQKATEEGSREVIPYSELSRLIGADVRRGQGYSRLAAAIGVMTAEYGRLFAVVRGEGVKWLTPQEQELDVHRGVRKMTNCGRRVVKRGKAAEIDEMTDAQRTRHLTTISFAQVMIHFSKPKSQERLRGAVAVAKTPVDFSDTIKLFLE